MSHLENTVTVITGASSGIGAATALKLAQRGSKIVLAARNEERLQGLVTRITQAGGVASFHLTDVGDRSSVDDLIKFTVSKYGKVDSLVNNAGLMLFSDWVDVAVDDWDQMINTNVRGYLHAIAAALPGMIAQAHGKILNMSSVAGLHVGGSSGVYSATKFFIRGITESLRKEVGVDHGIQVSMISPGVIDTGWADKVTNSDGKKAAQQLNKIAITPEQVAGAVAYVLDQPNNLTINDIVIHPTKQNW